MNVNSIATQNIQRDIAWRQQRGLPVVKSSDSGNRSVLRLSPIKSSRPGKGTGSGADRSTLDDQDAKFIVLSNTRRPTNVVEAPLPILLSRTNTVALENFTAHAVYSGAPGLAGAAMVTVRLQGRAGTFPLPIAIPYGRYKNADFARELERSLNMAMHKAAANFKIGATVPCTLFYNHSAPDLSSDVYSSHTTYIEAVGNQLPVLALRSAIDSATDGKISVVQKVRLGKAWYFACTALPPSRTLKTFPVHEAPCFAVLPKPVFVTGVGRGAKAVAREIIMSQDTSRIPEDRRGAYEYICRVPIGDAALFHSGGRDPAADIRGMFNELDNMVSSTGELPLCVLGAMADAIRIDELVFVTYYKFSEDRENYYIRVVAGEWAMQETADAGDGQLTTIFLEREFVDFSVDAATRFHERTKSEQLPAGFVDDGVLSHHFRVFTGTTLADFINTIEDSKKSEQDGGNPFWGHTRRRTDWCNTLAEAYLCKFDGATGGTVDGHRKLLEKVMANPGQFGEMCKEMLIVTLSPLLEYSPLELFLENHRLNSAGAEFVITGAGSQGLGLLSSDSRDGGVSLYETDKFLRHSGLSGSCGVQYICGFPIGFEDSRGRVTPKRLSANLRVNGTRMLGGMFLARHFAEIPTHKALGDVYDNKSGGSVKLQGTTTDLGVDIEDGEGNPVYGEYTVVIRMG